MWLAFLKVDKGEFTSCHAKETGMDRHIHARDPRAAFMRASVVFGLDALNDAVCIYSKDPCGFMLVPGNLCTCTG